MKPTTQLTNIHKGRMQNDSFTRLLHNNSNKQRLSGGGGGGSGAGERLSSGDGRRGARYEMGHGESAASSGGGPAAAT